MSDKAKPTPDQLVEMVRERLSAARHGRRMTQTKVGAELSVSASQYSRLENGQADMTLRQFFVACEAVRDGPSRGRGCATSSPKIAELRARLNAYEGQLSALRKALHPRTGKDAWGK